MILGYTTPEIIVALVLFALSAGALVAAIDSYSLNARIINLFEWFEESYDDAGGWFTRLLWGVFLFPSRAALKINHEGWRSGLVASSLFASVFVFFALLGLFIFIGIGFLVITIALWLLGAILGGSSK